MTNDYTPKPGEPIAFTGNFVKVPHSFIDLLLPHLDAQSYIVLDQIWRNTYGRRDMTSGVWHKRSTYQSNWEVVSGKQMGNRLGFKTLDPTRRGLKASAANNIFTSLQYKELLMSTNLGQEAGVAKSSNHYAIGLEIWNLLGSGNLSWQALSRLNIETEESQPCKPTYNARFKRPEYVDEDTWEDTLDYGRADKSLLSKYDIKLNGSNRLWLPVIPEEIRGGPFALDICSTAYFELPTSVIDFIQPNIPTALYPLLIYVSRNTLGRYNIINERNGDEVRPDSYERCRSFKTFEELAEVLGVSVRKVKYVVGWAKLNGILDVRTVRGRGGKQGKNGYLVGEEVWRVWKTGDFSPEYRAENLVSMKPSPAVVGSNGGK